jgi:hypothetical protein
VPQLYGSYVPVRNEGDESYLSLSLLLGHYREPISIDKLTYDERGVCAALFFALQSAGWVQQSVAECNDLWQRGPFSQWSDDRSLETKSFRVIDFGRGMQWDDKFTAISEKGAILQLLCLLECFGPS